MMANKANGAVTVLNPFIRSHSTHLHTKKPKRPSGISAFLESLAATYSRGSYTTTTIGKAAFDGRVRNGIGSDHSFMATKVLTDGHNRFCGVVQRFGAARHDF
jgi:hypothetical protein